MNRADEHAWVQERLAAWRCGLLVEPGEEERLRSHLAGCAACRDALADFSSDPAPYSAGEHLPSGLLARWDRSRKMLRGIEASMVREHLGACAECREELSLLGYGPELDSGEVAAAPAEAAVGRTAEKPVEPSAVHRFRTETRVRWALGAWAVTMTATALVLAFVRPHTFTPPSWEIQPAPAAVLGAARGVSGGALDVTAGTRTLVLGLPDILQFPSGSRVHIEVTSPDGGVLVSAALSRDELASHAALVLSRRAGRWQSGAYRIFLADPKSSLSVVNILEIRVLPDTTRR